MNRLRREGFIPAVIYGKNRPVHPVFVKQEDFATVLRGIQAGSLSTTVFELSDGHTTHRALVKEVQYHRSTYAVEHIDFALLLDDQRMTVKVPIQITGAADCPGVKLGGFVRQAIRSIKVSCLPKDIPTQLSFDVADMQIASAKRLSDLVIPAGVIPKAKMNEVAVVIAKKA